MSPSPRIPGHRLLHSPGPTRLPDEVLHAMSRQPVDLADARLDATIADCEAGLKRLLHTQADVLMYTANGHGAWEAVVVNLLAPGRRALIPGTGHFSESWALQTEALGGSVVRTPWHEGQPIDTQAVEQVLREPAPLIKVEQLADSSVNILFRVWTSRTDWWPTKLDLVQRCKEALEAGGITIPFPQRELLLRPSPADAANELMGSHGAQRRRGDPGFGRPGASAA